MLTHISQSQSSTLYLDGFILKEGRKGDERRELGPRAEEEGELCEIRPLGPWS
jgi:hypothetical protein